MVILLMTKHWTHTLYCRWGILYVCNGSCSGSHGCISPGLLLLSYGCPLHLECMNPISIQFCQMVRSAATSSRSSGLILHFFKAFFIWSIYRFLGPPSWTSTMMQLAVGHSEGQETWGHPYHMPQPLQLALGDHVLNTSTVGYFFLSISVWGTWSRQVTPRMHWRQIIWTALGSWCDSRRLHKLHSYKGGWWRRPLGIRQLLRKDEDSCCEKLYAEVSQRQLMPV